ncbi:gamma-glutamylcyclotransferase [Pseudoalteromonas luteoviolacea]|uniref:gamma-glutamylcyclotransferase family protein n=1 Tax=Pseudoalteromonas luteoviolacea TaxID=43657 RepID=UPI001B39026A|nr:gamma-glutamylcyclotransferase family protein [Pseudoalteromonas luteoviolacea]MBQ4810942.1 gamma-glutamylcyclotransferase [Pseudoalteromonas luteoviolacea]
MHALFSYGTLQQKQVQIDTFGRELEGFSDKLIGYELGEVEITDEQVIASSGKRFHPILKQSSNKHSVVSGTVFMITDDELKQADNYEADCYKRIVAPLASGNSCWIYAEE